MASSNTEFSDYKRIAPSFDEPPRERGCFFYGCIIAIVLALLLMVAIGVITFLVYRWIGGLVDEYTSTTPRPLPTVQMPDEQRASLHARVEAFRSAVEDGRPTGPLVLSSEELNALIEDSPRANLKGKVYVTIEQDNLKGQISLPLNDLPSFGLTRGRYLNGEAEFNIRLEDGEPFVTIRSLEVNGKRPSDEFMKGLKGQNLIKNIEMDSEDAKVFHRLDSIYVKDGKLIITIREPSKHREDGPPATDPRGAAPDGKLGEPPAGKSPARQGGADRLPDDVLAPPDSRPGRSVESAGKP